MHVKTGKAAGMRCLQMGSTKVYWTKLTKECCAKFKMNSPQTDQVHLGYLLMHLQSLTSRYRRWVRGMDAMRKLMPSSALVVRR
jgi:hypothetical protein